MDHETLFKKTKQAQNQAQAPYSNFPVGAALLTKNGDYFTGCNVESSSYGLTMCAERIALYKALSEGEREFTHLAILSPGDFFCPPCGACRQVLWDYAKDLTIILFDQNGHSNTMPLADFLPHAFDEGFLNT